MMTSQDHAAQSSPKTKVPSPRESDPTNMRAMDPSKPNVAAPVSELLATIRTLGGILDDLERVRIMATNRVAAQEREYGSSLPHLDLIIGPIEKSEHQAELELVRAWRRHPLAAWAKNIQGVGEKSIARLISHIGEPQERPNVAKLWAYCGVGDPARKRHKGMTQEEAFKLGNPAAKKQCWLIGEALVKRQCDVCRAEGERAKTDENDRNWNPPGCGCADLGYTGREVYNQTREQYADRVHADTCVRCGPAGKPALAGSPWSLKHQHEAAKRKAVKMFLKDLWVASRHFPREDQGNFVGGKI